MATINCIPEELFGVLVLCIAKWQFVKCTNSGR